MKEYSTGSPTSPSGAPEAPPAACSCLSTAPESPSRRCSPTTPPLSCSPPRFLPPCAAPALIPDPICWPAPSSPTPPAFCCPCPTRLTWSSTAVTCPHWEPGCVSSCCPPSLPLRQHISCFACCRATPWPEKLNHPPIKSP